ncbi:unnamed protein product [Pocillopora meandrina]|uniref:HAT C-terminal dimerisation domain-containing protein n=1 Tax=Pocillopora meandrina TaxID=46732 RepID=A0AAU9XTF9_9CNID|nr:unnamed protein product [Pocillopora meandrina]
MSKITNFFTPGTSNGGKRSKVSSNSDNNKDEDEEPPAKRSLKSTSSEATERFASSKKSSVSSEDVYRIINDVFTEDQKKKKLDERQKVNDSVLFKVFYSIYWLVKEGIANKKAAGLLTLLEKLGVNDLKYFDHRSPASVREMFSTLGCAVKENVVTRAKTAGCFGLLVDDVSDISVMEQMITFIQFYDKDSSEVTVEFLSQLKNLKLSNEKSRKMVAKKLQKACDTRWLSFSSAIQSLYTDLVAVLQTLKQLKQDPGQPAAYGLLKKINKVKFIGAVYILKWVLPILATLSKSFQKGAINYVSIKPSIDYSKDRLNDVKITEEPIKQLKQDLTSGGRLETLELVCTESNFKDLQGLLQKYIKALVKNIDKRFKSSLPVLSAFSAFDPMLMPNRQSPAFHSHGDTEVKVLADHFFDGDDSEAEEFKTEWKKLKYDLLSWKEHIPKDTADGKKSTPTEWSLKRVMAMKSTFGQFYPKSVQVAEAALAIPVSNAWPERDASQLKLIKTRIRSQIKNDLLASLLHVAINGPVPHTEACDSLVSKAVDMWKAAKKRRKLPHHRPSTQPQANSETEVATPITVVQDMGTQTDVTSTTELQNIREEYEEALHVLHLDDMVEGELDSLEAFAKSMETDDSGDSGVDE